MNNQQQLEDAVRTFLDLGVEGDVAASVECLADDALYHLNSWNAPFVGRDAIRADFDRQRTLWSDFRYQLLNIATGGNVVFTERIDTVRVDGRDVSIHVAGVFEFDDAGKIASWRDYFDTAEIDAQVP
ncbi:MAG: limonene-1,2-epoxide hydrolase family protein [Acidimicrobiia bacterium]